MSIQRVELSGLPVDQRGHRQVGFRRNGILDASISLIGEDGDLTDGHASIFQGAFDCSLCDACPGYDIVERPDGVEHPSGSGHRYGLRAKTECTLPNGTEIVFSLDVPSGRIIVKDDLRPVFNVPLRHEIDVPGYNSAAGQALHCAEQAAIGVAYGPVLRDPSLVRIDPDRYAMVFCDDEAEPGEDGHFDGEILATVCTDLWAYSIADFDHWLTEAKAYVAANPDVEDRAGLLNWVREGANRADLPWSVSIVDVTPGTYRFTHHTARADFDQDDSWPLVAADIERIA